MNKKSLKLVKITEELSDKIYDMFQEIPKFEPTQDQNVANGLSRDDFRKYCVVLEMASKNIMLSYMVPQTTYYILFDGDEPIGWFLLKAEKLRDEVLHAGHIGYTIRPTKRVVITKSKKIILVALLLTFHLILKRPKNTKN